MFEQTSCVSWSTLLINKYPMQNKKCKRRTIDPASDLFITYLKAWGVAESISDMTRCYKYKPQQTLPAGKGKLKT